MRSVVRNLYIDITVYKMYVVFLFYVGVFLVVFFFFFQAEDGIRDYKVTGVQTCALPIFHAQPGLTELLAVTRLCSKRWASSRRRSLRISAACQRRFSSSVAGTSVGTGDRKSVV